MNIRAHVFVEGKVQGVFYRFWTKQTAEELAVTGWVKNIDEGTVEAVFEGDKEKVEEMVERCKVGSGEAEVKHVDVTYEDASGEFKIFEVR